MKTEGVSESDTILKRSVDMRYAGQWRSLTVPISTPFKSVEEAVEGFSAQHMREYNYVRKEANIEIFRLNLSAIGVTPKAELAEQEPNHILPQPEDYREVVFDGKLQKTALFWREKLSCGAQITGPTIVHQLDSTTVIPPSALANVDSFGNIVIDVKRN